MKTDDILRLLSGVKITDMASLRNAIGELHSRYRIPHIIITSVNLSPSEQDKYHPPDHLSVVGSSMTSDGRPRLFNIVFPAIDCYFSGTGDMFSALMTVRMRQVATTSGASTEQLKSTRSWLSSDDVDTLDLPLVKAAELVVASMHEVLTKTAEGMKAATNEGKKLVDGAVDDKRKHLAKSKNSELKLVRNLASLRDPKVELRAKKIEI